MAEGAEIVWVLEQDARIDPGTAQTCMESMDVLGNPSVGWCVGDGETQPEPGVFDDSPFSDGRGFDIIVRRDTMEIVFSTNHGTPSGNENLGGQEVLEAVQDVVSTLGSVDPAR